MIHSRARRILVFATLAAAPCFAADTDPWLANGPPGASVYAIAPAPSNPSVVYAGTGRGVWRGERGGESWQPASAGLPVDRVQALAVDPADANVVYAGTLTPGGVPSVGIFKSTDGGTSWAAANTGLFDPFTGIEPLDVPALSIDPTNPAIILAGTRFSEIFRSTDAGATWTPRTQGGAGLGLETTDFARDPSDPQRIYAATTLGLLLSTDGGDNWDLFGDEGITLFTIAVDPASPSTIYAGNVNGFGVGKSTNSGANWTDANGNLPSVEVNGVTFFPPILSVDVAPDGSAVYVATQTDGIFKSTDGGATWTAVNAGLNETFLLSLAFLPGQPATTLLAGGNGGGVYRTADAGASWAKSALGLNEALVSEVVASPGSPGVAYASAFDGVYATGDGAQSWSRASGGLPPAPVAALAMRFVVTLQPGDNETLFAGTLGGGLWSSVDGGTTWSPSGSGLDDDFVSAVVVGNATTLYAGTDHPFDGSNPQSVYKSTDSGQTWTRTSLDPGGFSIDVLAVDPDDSSRVAAVSRGATGYFASDNGGAAWRTVNPGPQCGGVHTLRYETPGDGILIGTNTGVCRSDNGGSTWTSFAVAPLAVVEDLLFDPNPNDPAVVYAAASPAVPGGIGGGVFRSADGGRTWAELGTGLGTFSVRSLAFDASRERLYAGIFRGGVAVLSLAAPTRETPQLPASSERETRVIERP